MRISILSVSCCNPAMRTEDQRYLAKVDEALARTSIEAQVRIVTISEARSALSVETVNKMRPLLDRYGLSFMPAMLIDEELVLYGGIPTVEKMIEVIEGRGRSPEEGPVLTSDKNENGKRARGERP